MRTKFIYTLLLGIFLGFGLQAQTVGDRGGVSNGETISTTTTNTETSAPVSTTSTETSTTSNSTSTIDKYINQANDKYNLNLSDSQKEQVKTVGTNVFKNVSAAIQRFFRKIF